MDSTGRGPLDPRLWRASTAVRRYLGATVGCGVVISGCAIAAAIVLGHLVAGVITDPSTRSMTHWRASLLILLALWTVRTLTQWLQARLGQRGASAVIADLNGQVLRTVTALPPAALATRRGEAATVVTGGLDGLRPYFTGYLPALFLAAILTPATVVVIAFNDLQSALIVLVALPLIPIFMVLIGLATAERSSAALAAMTTLQSRLLDLIAGIPTLRALGRADGPAERIASLGAAHRRSAMATLRIAFLSALVLELIATLGVALVAVSIGLRLVFGEMTLATGLTVLLLAPDVFWPLRRVGVEFHAAQNGKAAADKAFALIGQYRQAPVATRTVEAAGAVIHLDDISVAGRDGLSPHRLSARIAPGRVTVLTGPNGAGKSTTLHVIAGLVEPTEGRVSVDGVDITELDRAARGGANCPGWLNVRRWYPAASRRTCRCSGRCRINNRPAGQQVSTTYWPICRRVWAPGWGAAGRVCHWASGSDSAWPVRSARGPRSCCWMNRPLISTRPPRRGYCGPSPPALALEPRWSSSRIATACWRSRTR